MTNNEIELMDRLEAYSPDKAGVAFPLSSRLARENGWDRAFALRVIDEYKKFCFLAMVAGHPVTPSEEVDEAWHLHLVYSRSYWDEFCGEVLRAPLHHHPTEGGSAEGEKFHDWYTETLGSYRKFFHCDPPEDIWPAPTARFSPRRIEKIDRSRNWVIPKLKASTAGMIVGFFLLAAGLILTAHEKIGESGAVSVASDITFAVLDTGLLLPGIFVVVILTVIKFLVRMGKVDRTCKKCGISGALKRTGATMKKGKATKDEEWRCRYCHHTEWRLAAGMAGCGGGGCGASCSSDSSGCSSGCGGGCGGCGGCGG